MDKSPFSRQEQAPTQGNVDLLEISQNVNNVAARLRVLEDRYNNLRKKMQLTDQNVLQFEHQLTGQIKQMQLTLEMVQKGFTEVQERISTMGSEMVNAVKASEFKVIEKYLDALQPFDFVTRKQFEDSIQSKDKNW